MDDKKSKNEADGFIPHMQTRGLLVLYDALIFVVIGLLMLALPGSMRKFTGGEIALHFGVSLILLLGIRFAMKVYKQIWRYGGVQCYIRLMISDGIVFLVYAALNYTVLPKLPFTRALSLICLNCLGGLAMRLAYRYLYKKGKFGQLVTFLSFGKAHVNEKHSDRKIKVAIVGAGTVGVSFAEELINNPQAAYLPRCFIENDTMKIGREIHNLPVLAEDEKTLKKLRDLEIQEVIIAVQGMDQIRKNKLYHFYRNEDFKVKIYDYPVVQTVNGKRSLREFDIEDLLFRKQVAVADERTTAFYRDKVVLITGGGGSIGSELCRQIAKMGPKRIVILDVYENGAYEVQQELKIAYGDKLDVKIVIVSVCNRVGLERAFREYRPQIVINAAAHKHVPLMEKDCIEAVENNVFGTLNSVELAEQYGVERFVMVSTDKAVNPTNVMGATKRMCEMIVLNHQGKMTTSATRFGNVLGSAGSVIPLFKKQIAAGGPVTITDKRIIRYFMTIPEAAQLVLQSGAMAKDKELFVLDMGQPVKILELAENMIRLSGQTDIEIKETGLRPGEKLYEELLVKSEDLDMTENEMIFIERDKLLETGEVEEKLKVLREAIATDDDAAVKAAMKAVVPTFRDPEEVNVTAEEEMKELAAV